MITVDGYRLISHFETGSILGGHVTLGCATCRTGRGDAATTCVDPDIPEEASGDDPGADMKPKTINGMPVWKLHSVNPDNLAKVRETDAWIHLSDHGDEGWGLAAQDRHCPGMTCAVQGTASSRASTRFLAGRVIEPPRASGRGLRYYPRLPATEDNSSLKTHAGTSSLPGIPDH